MSSSPRDKDPITPPPVIGKIGPYTVFLTPQPRSPTSPKPPTPTKTAPPPVRPPPAQFEPPSDKFGFFWQALAKAQNVHASLDEFMANWLGLNQSKFQWALDDYYESQGMGKGDAMTKEISNKSQTV